MIQYTITLVNNVPTVKSYANVVLAITMAKTMA